MLEQPLKLPSGAVLKNRIAKASMTEGLADGNDRATAAHATLYGRWARGGAGLLLTGNIMVDGRYLERVGNLVLADESGLDPLRRMTEAGRQWETHLFAQLSHPGRQTLRTVAPTPVAPSEVEAVHVLKAFGKPRALTAEEVEEVVERFARAAAIAERAGFTGVQVHGAHGYLVSQFLSPLTNRRTDAWGGSTEKRARFLLEILRAIRRRVGDGFAVAVKLNSADFQRGGFTEEESMRVIQLLNDERLDLLEISGGSYESPVMFQGTGADGRPESTRFREAYFLEYARKAREIAAMPIMLTGGFRTRAVMEEALASGAVDLVGLARPLALDPELPQRLLVGEIERATAPAIRAGTKALDALAEGSWYGRQLELMSRGRDPDASLSGLYSGLRALALDAWRARRRRSVRPDREAP